MAPEGAWTWQVGGCSVTSTTSLMAPPAITFHDIYPNPARAITAIPVSTDRTIDIRLEINDLTGAHVQSIYRGPLPAGKKHFFVNASTIPAGLYAAVLHTPYGTFTQKMVVQH